MLEAGEMNPNLYYISVRLII